MENVKAAARHLNEMVHKHDQTGGKSTSHLQGSVR
jgi:hypothetical protein